MRTIKSSDWILSISIAAVGLACVLTGMAQTQERKQQQDPPPDAVTNGHTHKTVAPTRPEQKKTDHDRSPAFESKSAPASSGAVKAQPKEGKNPGFDFYKDPLGAERPGVTFEEVMAKESAGKGKVMDSQKRYLETRYDLAPKLDPEAKMSRGKPLCVGPTARLPQGMTMEKLGSMKPEEIRSQGIFPYAALPHPLHANGGQVFPRMQIEMFPRLERFDVDFDVGSPGTELEFAL